MIQHSKPTLTEKDINAVIAQMSDGQIADGHMSKKLITHLANLYHAYGGISACSGSRALLHALNASGVQAGDKVAIPTYVCPTVLSSVLSCGAIPIFLDTKTDFTICDKDAKEKSVGCNVIIVPHLFGIWSDCEYLFNYYNIIIEDFAQCVYIPTKQMRYLIGNYGVFSFQATKVITAGEGGAVLGKTDSETAKLLSTKNIQNSNTANNLSPLSDLQASLALSQLEQLSDFLDSRQRLAKYYAESLIELNKIHIPQLNHHTFFRFPLFIKNKIVIEDVIEKFARQGIAVRKPLALLSHRYLNQDDDLYPGAMYNFCNVLSLPIYPALTLDEQDAVIEAAYDIFADK